MTKTKPELTVSASQISNFLDCPRKWWFFRVMKLKEIQKSYFTFGTVLHGCIERWMAADKSGRVPEEYCEALAGQVPGEPVDVFPPGWETVDEKGSKVSVTPNEAQLIKALFTEAVEKGVIVRDPHTTVEREINLPLLENVELTGYIDMHLASVHGSEVCDEDAGLGFSVPEIHDHKSFGESSTRYLKQPGPSDMGGNLTPIEAPYSKGDGTSPNSIGHDQQVLTYAAATSILDGYNGVVKVRHNQFPKFKDAKGVRKVEALVSQKRLMTHWAFLQDTAKRMLVVSRIKKWTDVPGPESTDTCSKYGGCPFQGICGKRETPEVYSQRIERQTKQKATGGRPNLPLNPRKRKTNNDTGDKSMTVKPNIFARANEQQAARKGGATATAPAPSKTAAAKVAANPKAPPKINSAAPAPVETAKNGAPWANETCPACKGLGVNTKGGPCPICDKTAEKRGKPTSGMYQIDLDGTTFTAVLRSEHAESGAEESFACDVPNAVAPKAPGGTPKPTLKPKPAPEPEPEPEATAAPEEVEPEVVEEEPEVVPVADPKPAMRPTSGAAARAALTRPAGAPAAAPVASRVAPKPAAGSPGRPRVGITILIGASMLQGPDRPIMLGTALLEKVGAELAADMGAESYWALDSFKRRDRIRQKAAEIAESLGKTVIIVSSTNDPDLMSLINGLAAAPACEAVIEGLR